MESHERVAGVILAGGRSSRMGMTDKALLPLAGKPLLAHVIARLAPQVADIVVSANGDLSRFAPFGLPVVADSVAGYPGPLAGVLAGLEWAAVNRPAIGSIVTVPTDTPFFPLDLVARFLAVKRPHPTLLVARSESGVHPVVGLWPVEIAPDLARALAAGHAQGRRVDEAAKGGRGVVSTSRNRREGGGSLLQRQPARGSRRG